MRALALFFVSAALPAAVAACRSGPTYTFVYTVGGRAEMTRPWLMCTGAAEPHSHRAYQLINTTHVTKAARAEMKLGVDAAASAHDASAEACARWDAALLAIAEGDRAEALLHLDIVFRLDTGGEIAQAKDARDDATALPAPSVPGSSAPSTLTTPAPYCTPHPKGYRWDGKDTVRCCKEELVIDGVTANLPGKPAIVMVDACTVSMKDSNITAARIVTPDPAHPPAAPSIHVKSSKLVATEVLIELGVGALSFEDTNAASDDLGILVSGGPGVRLTRSLLKARTAIRHSGTVLDLVDTKVSGETALEDTANDPARHDVVFTLRMKGSEVTGTKVALNAANLWLDSVESKLLGPITLRGYLHNAREIPYDGRSSLSFEQGDSHAFEIDNLRGDLPAGATIRVARGVTLVHADIKAAGTAFRLEQGLTLVDSALNAAGTAFHIEGGALSLIRTNVKAGATAFEGPGAASVTFKDGAVDAPTIFSLQERRGPMRSVVVDGAHLTATTLLATIPAPAANTSPEFQTRFTLFTKNAGTATGPLAKGCVVVAK